LPARNHTHYQGPAASAGVSSKLAGRGSLCADECLVILASVGRPTTMKSFAFISQTNDESDWLQLDRDQTTEQRSKWGEAAKQISARLPFVSSLPRA
jgi:hypothetical protein